ncbi:carbonic anhydrase [Alphaproteobacteria bacterium]|nr:carbonic anhydrase [Alphaproteobacteria bacterium]
MEQYLKILPNHLIERYKNWKKSGYEENKSWYTKIASEGQNPSSMIISCCDSRIHVTSIFGADLGEFFIHRNIANLVPPYNPDGDHHGTSAAVEYAVRTLKVSSIIILGHSHCGGIDSGYHLCKGNNKLEDTVFISKWLNILQPAFNRVMSCNKNISDSQGINSLEKESIVSSLKNLTEFPFVNSLLKKKNLSLHGLWHDIGSGSIEYLDPESLKFKSI